MRRSRSVSTGGCGHGNMSVSAVGVMEAQRQQYRTSADPAAAPRSTTEAFGNARSESETDVDLPPTDALKEATARIAELKEYAGLYVAAKLDGVKLTVRNIALYAVLGIVGGIVGAAVLVTAAVYLLSGLAGAIGELFPEPYEWWAGRLIVSVLVLGGTVAGVMLLMRSLTGASRKRTVEKYEQRKRTERDLFGHDAQERAREQVQRQ